MVPTASATTATTTAISYYLDKYCFSLVLVDKITTIREMNSIEVIQSVSLSFIHIYCYMHVNPPAPADPGIAVPPFLAPPCPGPQVDLKDARPRSRSCCLRGSLLPNMGLASLI
jgi:hypothetical protein